MNKLARSAQLFVAIACIASTSTSANASLIAHWSFDENTGSTVTDSVNGNVGTFAGGGITFSSTVPSAIGSGTSVSFSEANNQIVVPDSVSLSLTSDFTIAAWINPEDTGSHRNIVAKDGNNAYRYRLLSDERQWILLDDDSGAFQVTFGSPATAVTNGAWNHIAMSTDFTAGEIKFYLNGSLVDTQAVTETGVADTGGDFLIGNYLAGNGESYRGLMDDLRVYDHALSLSEVNALAVPESSAAGLIGLGMFVTLMIRRRLTA